MRKFLVSLCAAALSVGTAVSSVAPVAAAPILPMPAQAAPNSDLIQVQDWRRIPRGAPGWNGRPVLRGAPGWNGRPGYRDGYYRYRGNPYYNGHRGYSYYRPGYRRYNDFWFPAGAFVAGALLGGALASPGPVYDAPVRRVYGGESHVQWCYNRYRSYRAYDNTFQPYNGPRQQCYSPYS